MKKLTLIAFGILLWAVSYSQVEDYEVVAWDDLTTLGNFTIDDDIMRNTTQIGVLDTTFVTLDYLGLNFVKNPADSLQFYREAVTTGHNAYKVDVDTTNGALRFYNDEVDIAMQMGQELWMKVKNNNGSTFLNGIIVYISGSESGFPTVLIAHDRDFETVGAIGMLTHDVEAGTFGFLTTYGTVGGLDTSGETPGAIVYVDTLNGGKNWTTTIPEFANFQYEIGFIHTVDPTEGKIFLNPKGQVDDVMHNINNANILENFNFTSASNGTTITGTLESADGKDYLTVRWSDGFAKIAVPVTITIPEGTDNDSQTSYIYIPKSTGVLTSSTSYFPIGTQYKTISRTEAWTALRTQTEGLKGNQNYNDFVASTVSLRGRIAQIGNWQRLRSLKYINGSNGTVTVGTNGAAPDTVTYAVTQGNWSQANEQVLDAMDMFTGDDIHAFNYPDHTDTTLFDLNEILVDATGTSLANRSWTFVYWISQNKTGEQSHMYVNLPNGSYSSGAAAEADALGYKVTEIPYEMRPYSGFVTEVVMTHTNPSGGTWTVYSSTNIQGNEPGYAGGGGAAGGTGTFDLLSDTPASKAGSSNKIVGVDLLEANLEYKNVTIDGSGTINIPTGEEYQINGNNLKLTDLDSTGFLLTQSQVVGLVDTISTLVPYDGADTDLDLGGQSITAGIGNFSDHVFINTNNPTLIIEDGSGFSSAVNSTLFYSGTNTVTIAKSDASFVKRKLQLNYSLITDGQTSVLTIPDADGTIALTSDIGGGTVTNVSSSTTDQLTVANGTTTPALTIVTAAVADAGTALATGDQIDTYVQGELSDVAETNIQNDFSAYQTISISRAGSALNVSNPSGSGTGVIGNAGFLDFHATGSGVYAMADRATDPSLGATTGGIYTKTDENIYFRYGTNTPIQLASSGDVSGKWNNDGTSTATGDWDMWPYSLITQEIDVRDSTSATLALTKMGTGGGSTYFFDDGNSHIDASTDGRYFIISGNNSGNIATFRNSAGGTNLITFLNTGYISVNSSTIFTLDAKSESNDAYIRNSAGKSGVAGKRSILQLADAFNGKEYSLVNDNSDQEFKILGDGESSELFTLNQSGNGNLLGTFTAASLNANDGATGTFTTVDSKTVTVTNGIIVSIL